jgi:glutamate--cysteine ligase catalytic subunit
MEACITDFENAAFVAFTVLMTRVIASYDLNLYIPISKVDENMKRAHNRDAVNSEQFFFRKKITSADTPNTVKECVKYRGTDSDFADGFTAPTTPVEEEYEEMTINEIMNGKADGTFPGLIPLMTNCTRRIFSFPT